MEATASAPLPAHSEPAPPYPPSIHDRIMRGVQRIPLPYWLTYLLLFFLQFLIHSLLGWAAEA